MEKLWAPWRGKYISKIVKKNSGEVFSRIAREKNDRKNFVFVRTRYCYAVLNIYPYNNGHSLVVPLRKVKDLSLLTSPEKTDLYALLEYTKELLDEVLRPQGYNIGINLGRTAGAGFPQHLHIHIVPRWLGDANFMPITAHTKVISQSMQVLYDQLVKSHQRRTLKKKK